ncbi:MAG: GTP 3',8-cyclase MoaA [Beijerinckiaceae bacterium]
MPSGPRYIPDMTFVPALPLTHSDPAASALVDPVASSLVDPIASPLVDPVASPLVDPFGRHVNYIRVSVTDRCDFRCVYCMAEDMEFLPKRDLLTLEELDRLCSAFVARGTKKIRLTGGEPLVRRNVMGFIRGLSRHLETGALEELTLTTNGSQLAKFAGELAASGVKRINVSMDSRDPEKFKAITRWGDLAQVMRGVDAAQAAGLAVKINMVALKGVNDAEIPAMIEWAHGRGMDLTLIEVMPMGEVDAARFDQYLPLTQVRADLMDRYTLKDLAYKTSGPARYVEIAETGGRLGFITPLTHNFCESCNRVRVTCTGTLYMCLGQEDAADLRAALRASEGDSLLNEAITAAIARKPKGHDFLIDRAVERPATARHMSVTGG